MSQMPYWKEFLLSSSLQPCYETLPSACPLFPWVFSKSISLFLELAPKQDFQTKCQKDSVHAHSET